MSTLFDGLRRNGHRALLAVMVATFSAAALSACNTVEGAGQDIENAGEAIEDSAND
ncbi:entericidin A/B family lipoprotein [Pelagibius sp. 7325]|uniref:entericidin A/B family lipoprotein n=1 Tax=Pelagibius sp. 7325 TaxID=3131994 RepID=UPI0030EB3AA3